MAARETFFVERYELSFLSARCEVWKYNYWCLPRRKWKHRAVLCEAGRESRGRLRGETSAPGARLRPSGMAWRGRAGRRGGQAGENAKVAAIESVCSKFLSFRVGGVAYLAHYFGWAWVPFSFCTGAVREV